MTVLVTGSTGTVGSVVVSHLAAHDVEVRALTRSPATAQLPTGVIAVEGDLTDPDAMRSALVGVSGLFLLSPVTPDELTGTLITLDVAREAGVTSFVYLSVIHADRFVDPPHFAAKAAAERMMVDINAAATILRAGYYMQNDAAQRDQILGGRYDIPLGNKGVLAIDTRDLGEIAARALLKREQTGQLLPRETFDVAHPDVLTGDEISDLWSEVVGRPVRYGGDDLDAFEERLRAIAPGWKAYDMRLMMRRYQRDGVTPKPADQQTLQALLGRPLRSYREFARETAAAWNG